MGNLFPYFLLGLQVGAILIALKSGFDLRKTRRELEKQCKELTAQTDEMKGWNQKLPNMQCGKCSLTLSECEGKFHCVCPDCFTEFKEKTTKKETKNKFRSIDEP